MPRFCANLSMLFTEKPLIERFQAAKNAGFQAVEIQFPYELPAEIIAQFLHDLDLKLVLFNVAADDLLQGGEGLAAVPEKRPEFREALSQALAYAEILKPEAVNILPGRCLDQSLYDLYLQTFKENLRLAVRAFNPLGIKTVFEAINTLDMPGFIINTGKQMRDVLAQLQLPGLWMQYDSYHACRMGDDPVDFIRRYAGQTGHIQFADCPGRGQPGTGNTDFDKLFAAVDQSGYSGWVGAEYKPVSSSEQSLAWFSDINAV